VRICRSNAAPDPLNERYDLSDQSFLAMGGALAAPSTAYLYDWNILPIGQLMWMKELETYREFPALQTPASYNLDNIIKAMQDAKHISHAGD
jgi:hypothetical protein